MTVRELIEKLQQQNDNEPVRVWISLPETGEDVDFEIEQVRRETMTAKASVILS
jgi:hypothetical protein